MARHPARVRISSLVAALLVLFACGSPAWKTEGTPKVAPDEQFRTGVEVGYDAWIWHCHENQRVVIIQSGSALCGTSRPKIHRGACGAPLAEESSFPPTERRHEVPEGYRWPTPP